MLTWIFVISLTLPSFGGPVHWRAEATSERACKDLRKAARAAIGEFVSVPYVVSICQPQESRPIPPPEPPVEAPATPTPRPDEFPGA